MGGPNLFYAHSLKDLPKAHWHTLPDHLRGTSTKCHKFAVRLGIGLESAAALAGLLHDLGKYDPNFQRRLTDPTLRVEHSTAGAVWIKNNAPPSQNLVSQLISYCIAGHHAGLPDMSGSAGGGWTLNQRLSDFDFCVLDPSWTEDIHPSFDDIQPRLKVMDRQCFDFQLSVLGRMIFSCLVDADFKDTEAFFDKAEGRVSARDWSDLQSVLPTMRASFHAKIASFTTETPINKLRSEILHHVLAQAAESPGLFTLTVPTGGGKTLASLGFALHHASAHRLDRIIYAAPFTSIIDQTAAIFKDILGNDNVLEHHSAIEDANLKRGNDDRSLDQKRSGLEKLKLAMQDWAAPVVVTTNVQLFESLFAARPSRCRKLHNIARSVIILDEAQTLPRGLLIPCMRMLEELSRNYGCSIILCTATQPALDRRHFSPLASRSQRQEGLDLSDDRELAPDPPELAKQLARVSLKFIGERSNDELVKELAETHQGLVIVNSRKHALALYQDAKAAGLEGLIHLTTRQYAAHRKRILGDIRARLSADDDRPCRVIATSLVEAGVDLDFPRVWRAEAGLDQIAQAAGRCNREGLRPIEDSLVSVFTSPDFPPPTEIAGLSGDMSRMFIEHKDDLLSPSAMQAYFEETYWRVGREGLDNHGIVGLFKATPASGTDFHDRTAAERFRMIESGMAPVIIPRDDKAKEAVDRLAIEKIPSGTLARDLQLFIVQVPPKARDLLIKNGHVAFRHPDLRGDQFAVLNEAALDGDTPLYSDETGLLWENADYLGFESWQM